MVEVLPPLPWAQRQFGGAELGDKRRTRRAVAYAACAAAAPSRSVPRQCGGKWKQTKGAYRLFDQPQVSFDQLQQPHRRQTLAAAGKPSQVVLWISDTTTVSFDHPNTTGLGPTSSGGHGQGMLLHTSMGVDVSGGPDASPFVLGLGHQQVWARPGQKQKTTRPESSKWSAGIEQIGPPPAGVRWVHVGDRESDCWEAIQACGEQSAGFAFRACQNRQVMAGHRAFGEEAPASGTEHRTRPSVQPTLLFELMQEQPALGHKKLWVRGRGDREARWAKLAVSAMPITLLSPRNWPDKPHRKGQARPDPITCWAVRVWEINPPAGEDPIEWVILTDEPVRDASSALKVVYWYSCRWLIEEYHKCLKTGCRIESRQLEKARRLEALLGILAIVAIRLLQLKHQAKVNPDAPAKSIVPERYVKTLAAHLNQSPNQLTTREFWRETARLGGFLCRKGDGEPGWLTLWRGWQHLETLTIGAELAKRMT
jgi:hypothetical protein